MSTLKVWTDDMGYGASWEGDDTGLYLVTGHETKTAALFALGLMVGGKMAGESREIVETSTILDTPEVTFREQ